MKKMILKRIVVVISLFFTILLSPTSRLLTQAAAFDPGFYGGRYPDVVNALGTDPQALYNHYLTYGMNEKRLPYEGAKGGETVEGVLDTKVPESKFVAIDKLANYKSLKKKMTDAEFLEAYNAALAVCSNLADKSREEQLRGIQKSLRDMVNSGNVRYSTKEEHYNDPYGYFVKGVASCAGCARATGLCLNILGIPYEHVNENKWAHQWCRVNIDGEYWICDAYGLYCGPEFEAYKHPFIR